MSQAKLISECFVRPRIEVDEAKRVYHLGPFELSLLSVNYVQAGFLFAKPANFSSSSHLERLRLSLSKALVLFYPLAGRLVTTRSEGAENSCCVHVDCSKGSGAKLIHAAAKSVTIFDIVKPNSDVPKLVRYFFDLGEVIVNYDGHTRALLSVQLTELKDGVFLGFCFNHCVLDGTSTMHFFKVWSDIFMAGLLLSSIPLPIMEKPEFFNGRIAKLPYLDPSEFIIRSMIEGQVSERFFHFSPRSLNELKVKANTEMARPSGPAISSFQALTAMVWKSITRARNLPLDEVTTCALPVNLRPRFKPRLTEDYFGNYFVQTKGFAKVGALLVNSIGWSAALLQQAVVALDEKAAHAVVSQALDEGPKLILPTVSSHSSNVIVGGSPRFNVHLPKFGLGRLVAFRGGYVNKIDGKVNAYSGSVGDGVDLEICLAPDTMSALLSDQEFLSYTSSQPHTSLNLISRI